MKILYINGSIHGANGQSGTLFKHLKMNWPGLSPQNWDLQQIILQEWFAHPHTSTEEMVLNLDQQLKSAQAIIYATGTYWDSWGSPLQKFLEIVTSLEGSQAFLGKPAAVFVTMHSVGGKSVLSRLQGVLNTLGHLIPPQAGFVYSLSTHLLKEELAEGKASQKLKDHADDLWSLNDLPTLIHNLTWAAQLQKLNGFHSDDAQKFAQTFPQTFQSWPVDRKNFSLPWMD